ncbi:UNVERIFIED_CONTAM: hypothetical protein Sindi_1252100 [Sesamum indicum]
MLSSVPNEESEDEDTWHESVDAMVLTRERDCSSSSKGKTVKGYKDLRIISRVGSLEPQPVLEYGNGTRLEGSKLHREIKDEEPLRWRHIAQSILYIWAL